MSCTLMKDSMLGLMMGPLLIWTIVGLMLIVVLAFAIRKMARE